MTLAKQVEAYAQCVTEQLVRLRADAVRAASLNLRMQALGWPRGNELLDRHQQASIGWEPDEEWGFYAWVNFTASGGYDVNNGEDINNVYCATEDEVVRYLKDLLDEQALCCLPDLAAPLSLPPPVVERPPASLLKLSRPQREAIKYLDSVAWKEMELGGNGMTYKALASGKLIEATRRDPVTRKPLVVERFRLTDAGRVVKAHLFPTRPGAAAATKTDA